MWGPIDGELNFSVEDYTPLSLVGMLWYVNGFGKGHEDELLIAGMGKECRKARQRNVGFG